jgi:hypothetical protein
MKNTTWKTINGFTVYKISNNGIVMNVKTNRILKTNIDPYGYVRIDLQQKIDGIIKYRKTSIHRLLAENFIDNPNNYKYVNHIDANRINNNLNNLEWCTPKQNMHHARYITKNGTVISKQKIIKIVAENPTLSKDEIIDMLISNCK